MPQLELIVIQTSGVSDDCSRGMLCCIQDVCSEMAIRFYVLGDAFLMWPLVEILWRKSRIGIAY